MAHSKTSKTKQRILNVSLQLFNQKGERSVTTNHIAAALEMSPGNLYYHYNNKQEIIKALTQQYQQEMLKMLALPNDGKVTPNDKLKYFHALSGQLWNYRFLHRDIYHLVENDQNFQKKYGLFSKGVMEQVQRLYQAFVDANLMKINSQEIEALIINIWIVLTNWTNFLFMSGHLNDQNQLDSKWLAFALRQIVFLESPYLIGESCEVYQKLLNTLEQETLFENLISLK